MRVRLIPAAATLLAAALTLLQHGPAGAATQITVPSAPSNLTAAGISTSAIRIEWADNSNNEDGFRIEHCAGSGCTDFVRLATVGVNATNATISNLGKNKTFTYRVCAYNGAGDSIYSNTATATTLR